MKNSDVMERSIGGSCNLKIWGSALILLLVTSWGIEARAGATNGRQAIQMVRAVLQKNVLHGKTPTNESCVIEQILPNKIRRELQIRVYLGEAVDDVPVSAAWIRLDPAGVIDLKKTQNLMILKNFEEVSGNASTSKIQAIMGLQENFQYRVLAVRIQTVSVSTSASYLPTRMADLTCVVGFDQLER